jgi:dynein heavy chain
MQFWAEPVIAEAMAALNTLDKKSLTELKSLASPPAGVDDVTAAVMVLSGGGKIPKDLSWNAAKKMMGNIDQFLKMLIEYDKDNTPDIACTYCEDKFISKPEFNVATMKTKSGAAAGMTAWVINICKYFRCVSECLKSEICFQAAR